MFIVENIEHIIKPSGHSGDEGQFKKHKLSFAVLLYSIKIIVE